METYPTAERTTTKTSAEPTAQPDKNGYEVDGFITGNRDTDSLKGQGESLRLRLFRTLCTYSAYLSMGFLSASLGPSLLDLQELLYTDTETIVIVFTFFSAGMLAGTIVSGFMINRLNDTFFFLVSALGMSAVYMASVWVRSLTVFCVFITLMGVFMASINCNIQVTVLRLWSHSKHQGSVLQGAHFTWSLGATISPFIIQPFLSEGNQNNNNMTIDNTTTTVYQFGDVTMDSNTTVPSIDDTTDVTELHTNVQYGFLTVGSLTLTTVILFLIALKLDGWRLRSKDISMEKDETEQAKQPLSFKIAMLIGIVILMFFYDHLEDASGNLLTTFVVEGLHWDKYKGPLITSVFWGVFGIGRLAGVFLSHFLTPVKLLYFDSSLVVLGYIVLMALIHVHEAVTWVGILMAGFGMGSFVAAGFTFINLHLTVDGVVSACIIGSFAVSSMSMTPLTGVVFAWYGPMSMVYIVFVSSLIVLGVFTSLHLFTWRWRKSHGGQELSTKELSINNSPSVTESTKV